MYVLAHLAFKNYDPPKIEKGMLFMNNRSDGVSVYEITESLMQDHDKHDIIGYLGYPLQVYIVDNDGGVLATPEEIGLWDVNGDVDNGYGPKPITPKELNHLIEEWDGLVEIACIDFDPLSSLPPLPGKTNGKVTLRSPVEVESEEEGKSDG